MLALGEWVTSRRDDVEDYEEPDYTTSEGLNLQSLHIRRTALVIEGCSEDALPLGRCCSGTGRTARMSMA